MLLKAEKTKKEYGIQEVLDIEKPEIWEGARIGLVGPNGAGKSGQVPFACPGFV